MYDQQRNQSIMLKKKIYIEFNSIVAGLKRYSLCKPNFFLNFNVLVVSSI